MSKRKTWNTLPGEILSLIVENCGSDHNKVKWMFVNKKCFNFYLSITFNTISIDLNMKDKKMDKIISSSFNPGRWVKHINFNRLDPPKNLDQLDEQNDCLMLLMKHTPNVEEIQFSHVDILNNQAWSYFSMVFPKAEEMPFLHSDRLNWSYLSMVLLKTNCWKLRVLPTLGKDKITCAPYYYSCAYRMRHTLEKMDLTIGMLGELDFECLNKFKALKTLAVDEKIVNNFDDLDLILEHTSNLTTLTVNFADNRLELTQQENEFALIENNIYSNLKELTFNNFTPKTNEELLVFIEKFIKVEKLCIVGEKNMQWPCSDVDNSTIDAFFDNINSIPEYRITVLEGYLVVNMITDWLKSIKEANQTVYLSVTYIGKDDSDYLLLGHDTLISVNGGRLISNPTLSYKIAYHRNIGFGAGVSALSNISEKTRQVEIEGVPSEGNGIELLLRAIISKENVNLETLIITNSSFTAYTISIEEIVAPLHIRRLELKNCKIKLDAFKSFSNEFTSLDYISFDSCAFEGNPNEEAIDLSHTVLGTFYMSNFRKMVARHKYHGDKIQFVIILSIYFEAHGRTRYYTIVEGNVIETTKGPFDLFRLKLGNDESVTVNIRVNSIKELVLMLTDNCKKVKISF